MPDLTLISSKAKVGRGETLACDLCSVPRQTTPGQTFEEMQALLREQGWLCRDRVDVCPTCRGRL